MAENILAFQAGREAAMCGGARDARRSADWLEGFDQTKADQRAAIAGWNRGNLPAKAPHSAETEK